MSEKNGFCALCKTTTRFVLHRQLFASGAMHFVWVCDLCKTRNPARDKVFFIPHEKVKAHLTPEQIENLPLLLPDWTNRCARCGRRECELHHWAPTHLFKDANEWPKDYLCPDCHNLWHSVVTPNMGGNHGT